MGVLSLNFGNK